MLNARDSLAALVAPFLIFSYPALADTDLMRDLDFDQNGIVTVDEVIFSQNALFDQADSNADGFLSHDEHDALLQAVADRHSDVGGGFSTAKLSAGRVDAFTFTDGNADGQISRLEYHTKARTLAEGLDRDGDGVVANLAAS